MPEILEELDTHNKCRMKEAIQRHNLIIIPTETVYGIAADATDSESINKIFTAKNRPADNPLIIHFYNKQHIYEFVDLEFSALESKIIDKLMPGSITLIKNFTSSEICPGALCGENSICIRIPSHPLARIIISNLGKPLAAPSANKSGRPSCTTANDCLNEFKNNPEVEFILDGGPCQYGLESTIIRVDGETIKIFRKGAVTPEDIKNELGDCQVEYASASTHSVIPGTKYKHYSPNAEVYVIKGDTEEIIKDKLKELTQNANGLHVLICVFNEIFCWINNKQETSTFGYLDFPAFRQKNVVVLNLGEKTELNHLGKYFYKILRTADEQGISEIYFEDVESKGLGVTIAERLSKASNNKTL